MGHELGTTITYCEVDGRLVFLDLLADRYFQLSDGAEAQFRKREAARLIAAREAATPQGSVAKRWSGLPEPRPCEAGPSPSASILDEPSQKLSGRTIGVALWQLMRVRKALRRGQLHQVIGQLQAAKCEILRPTSDRCMSERMTRAVPAQLRRLACDFERTARLARSHDQCLARAIVLTRMALARRIDVELVIGVQLRPFAAHAWVRKAEILLNDRIDNVRAYTPIFVL